LVAMGEGLHLQDGTLAEVAGYDFNTGQWQKIAGVLGSFVGIVSTGALVSSRRPRQIAISGDFVNIDSQFGFANVGVWNRQSWRPLLSSGTSFVTTSLGEPAEAVEYTTAITGDSPADIEYDNYYEYAVWANPLMLGTNPGGCVYYG